jgi:hypothetical protein
MVEGRRGSEVDEWGGGHKLWGNGRGTRTMGEWGGGGGCVERGREGVEILVDSLQEGVGEGYGGVRGSGEGVGKQVVAEGYRRVWGSGEGVGNRLQGRVYSRVWGSGEGVGRGCEGVGMVTKTTTGSGREGVGRVTKTKMGCGLWEGGSGEGYKNINGLRVEGCSFKLWGESYGTGVAG